jgi:anthranilate synthase component 1
LPRAAAYSFLLESVVGGERFGRYSFIGLPARTLVRAAASVPRRTEVVTDGVVVVNRHRQPAGFCRRLPAAFQGGAAAGPAALLRRTGGVLRLRHGALHREEAGKDLPARHAGLLPDILLLQCEELAVIDNLSGKLYLIVYADPGQPEAYSNAKKRLRDLKEQLKYSVSAPVVKPTQTYPPSASSPRPTTWPPSNAPRS